MHRMHSSFLSPKSIGGIIIKKKKKKKEDYYCSQSHRPN